MSEPKSLEDERKEWEAIMNEPRLDMLPPEALIASNRYLAGRLLEKTEPLSFEAWLHTGIEAGYCSEPVCNTHDGLPSSEAEDAEWEDGGDPCVPAVRLMWDMEKGEPAEP